MNTVLQIGSLNSGNITAVLNNGRHKLKYCIPAYESAYESAGTNVD